MSRRRGQISSLRSRPFLVREFSVLEVLRDVNQMLPAILCMNGHLKLRVAMELGFSCCLGEAWDTSRSGIESVVHAHKIHREPILGCVWSGKNEGPKGASLGV